MQACHRFIGGRYCGFLRNWVANAAVEMPSNARSNRTSFFTEP